MFNKTFLCTSLFGALFTTIALKFLQLFNFINGRRLVGQKNGIYFIRPFHN